jgi:hypothetical protein
VPSCALDGEVQPFLNESFGATLTLDNTGSSTGFVPAFELQTPPGITLDGVQLLGVAVALEEIGVFDETEVLSVPLTQRTVSGDEGNTLYFVRLPLSSHATTAPAFVADLTLSVADPAALGASIDIDATCLYAFGDDALNEAQGDAIAGPLATLTVTPSLVRVSGRVEPAIWPSGDDWPYVWIVSLDVATGAVIRGATATIPLFPELTIDDAEITVGTGSLALGGPPAFGGTAVASFGDITGTGAAIDAEVRVTT